MRKLNRREALVTLFVVLAVLLLACNGEATPLPSRAQVVTATGFVALITPERKTPSSTATQVAVTTIVPTATVRPSATNTPLATQPTSTLTPTPSATPEWMAPPPEELCLRDSSLTDAQMQQRLEGFIGKKVVDWQGSVYDVKRRGSAYIALIRVVPLGKEVSVRSVFESMLSEVELRGIPNDLALGLEKYQKVTFSGTIREFKTFLGAICSPLVIENATLQIGPSVTQEANGATLPSISTTPTLTISGCHFDSAFVRDITIPDDTRLKPGTTFTKTWAIRNTGTCTWTQEYRLAHVAGDKMGAPDYVQVPETNPGEIVEVSVLMTAPDKPGSYRSDWRMCFNDWFFGTVVYVQIISGISPTPTSTATPSEAAMPVFELDGLRYTIKGFRRCSIVRAKFLELEPAGVFGRLDLQVTNVTNEPVFVLTTHEFSLSDNRGRQFAIDSFNTGALSGVETEGTSVFLSELNPGISKQCPLLFDIPTDAEGLKFRACKWLVGGGCSAWVPLD